MLIRTQVNRMRVKKKNQGRKERGRGEKCRVVQTKREEKK